MKKKIRIAGAVLLSLLLLSACQKEEAAKNPEPVSENTQTADLTTKAAETEKEPEAKTESETVKESTADFKKNPSAQPEREPVKTIGVATGHQGDYYWDERTQCYAVSLEYPCMRLSEEYREQYPKLDQAVTELMEERKETRLEVYDVAIQANEEQPVESPEYAPLYEVTEKVAVRRADTRALSVLLTGYYYTGGVHGSPYNLGYTFDTSTGKELELTDVITDMTEVPKLVKEQLEIFWGMDWFYENLDLEEYFAGSLDGLQWVLDYNGVTFYFNPYEIAPYASGIPNVTLSFAEHPEIFNEVYREVPERYAFEFGVRQNVYFDVDGNGTLDSVKITMEKGEYSDYEMQTIWVNDVWYEEKLEFYIVEPLLVHTADGKTFLYLGQQYPDDFWVYAVYDLSEGWTEKVDNVYSGRHNVIDYENEFFAKEVITDPEHFRLDTYTQCLGTSYAYDTYHIGEDGLPVKEHDWYLIDEDYTFTLLKDVKAFIVNEEGDTVGETVLKKGEQVRYYRTDGESMADLMLSDGRIARVFMQREEWYLTVDGVDIEEIFDGMIFGG